METEWTTYWCHNCRKQFRRSSNQRFQCFHCQSELIQQYLPQNSPNSFRARGIFPHAHLYQQMLQYNVNQLSLLSSLYNQPYSQPNLQNCTFVQLSSLPQQSKQCSICNQPYQQTSSILVLPCIHPFHHSCIIQWLRRKKSCPICRFKIHN